MLTEDDGDLDDGLGTEGFDGPLSKIRDATTSVMKKEKKDDKVEKTAVFFDMDQYKGGFREPFVLVIGEDFDKESLLTSVKNAMKSKPLLDDKDLKTRFVAWFCRLFNVPNEIFFQEKVLEEAFDKIDKSVRRFESAGVKPAEADNAVLLQEPLA